METADQKQSGVLTGVPELSQSMPWPTLGNHSGPCCSSTSPLWGKGAAAGSGKSAHLEGTKPAWTEPFCYITLGPDPTPSRTMMATEHRGSSHLALALVSPSPAPPPIKVIAASYHPGRRHDPCSLQIQFSH